MIIKQQILVNFKKAYSSISKIAEMVENEEYTPKIMQQNLAVMGLLKSAHQMLLEKHLQNCFNSKSSKKQKAKNEILKVVSTK